VSEPAELRVLVCAPTGRDGPLLCAAMARGKIAAENLPDLHRLCACLAEGAGAVVLVEEALDDPGLRTLVHALGVQPPWSDLPLLLLTGGDAMRGTVRQRPDILERLNVTLVERPVAIATFMAAVRAALRARARQYAMRETLRQVEAQSAELRRAAEERARLLASERRARQAAEEANRAKDDFLAVISHELRTPLSAILGWTALLADRRVPEEKRGHAIKVIDRNARAQAQLVEDLLDVSRIISGKLKLAHDLVDPLQFVHAAVETVRLAAEARGVALELTLPPRSSTVLGDAGRLQQVVWNLVHNAIKFTGEGGRVHLALREGGGEVEIEVVDSGRGIAPQFLPYVFDRFRQAETPTTRSTGGLGLGLAICRHIVEAHGGSIEVASDGLAKGARFTVRLPAVQPVAALLPDAVAAAPTAERDGKPSAPPLSGIRVLVVDDDPDTRELLRSAFEACQAVVSEASSALEALQAIGEELPNVLVSDVAMPGEDGYSLIRTLRQRAPEDGGALPAVALTAFAREEDRRRALDAGFQLHVTKPVEPDALLHAVARLVSASPQRTDQEIA